MNREIEHQGLLNKCDCEHNYSDFLQFVTGPCQHHYDHDDKQSRANEVEIDTQLENIHLVETADVEGF